MELTKEVLHRRYSKFSDAALLAAQAAGPGPYAPLAWEVIQELVAARGLKAAPAPPPPAPPALPVAPPTPRSAPLVPRSASPPPAPSSPTPRSAPLVPRAEPREPPEPPEQPEPVEASAPAESPYLLLSRPHGVRWPADAPLPLAARDAMAVAAFIFGVAGLVFGILGIVRNGPAVALVPSAIKLWAATLLSLAFAYSARRPPSPAAWWLAVLYCGVSPAAALGRLGTSGAPPWGQLLLGVLVGVCWLVYFARRRPMYGLSTWGWVL